MARAYASTGAQGRRTLGPPMHNIIDFFRRNPQALVLLIICVVLGIGTFIAVLISIGGSSTRTGPGYPNGALTGLQALTGVLGR
jgi:hypothetical protein